MSHLKFIDPFFTPGHFTVEMEFYVPQNTPLPQIIQQPNPVSSDVFIFIRVDLSDPKNHPIMSLQFPVGPIQVDPAYVVPQSGHWTTVLVEYLLPNGKKKVESDTMQTSGSPT